jgi:tripartite-type tricarboxylate transporter receptor subunit TctC
VKRRLVLQTLASSCVVPGVRAQDAYPNRFIKLVVPFAAGGSTDAIGRKLAMHLGAALGQSVVIENVGGAAGVIGCAQVAAAPADGYTLLVGTTGTHAINASSMVKPAYDAVKDFAPIALVGVQPMGIAVNPKVPARNLQELAQLLRANPGKYSYASAGNGGIAHLSFELFKTLAGGVQVEHVPYKGGGPALQDAVAGHLGILSDTFSSVVPYHRSGALRLLACCGEVRSPAAPDIPTAVESGFPGMLTSTAAILLAPARTPQRVIERLSAAMQKVMLLPAFQAELQAIGAHPELAPSPQKTAAFITAEIAKWAPVVKATGTTM